MCYVLLWGDLRFCCNFLSVSRFMLLLVCHSRMTENNGATKLVQERYSAEISPKSGLCGFNLGKHLQQMCP